MSLPAFNNKWTEKRDILKNLKFDTSESILPSSSSHMILLARIVQQVIIRQCIFYASYVERICRLKKRPFTVSLIGCGQIGRALLVELVRKGVPRDSIFVSTRQPDLIRVPGIRCGTDSTQVAKRGCVVFLLCRYPQAMLIARSVSGRIRANSLFVSILAGVPSSKVQQLFGTSTEQTIRTHVYPARIKQITAHMSLNDDAEVETERQSTKMISKLSITKIAASELFATRDLTGVIDLQRAMVALSSKLGIKEATKVVFDTLFGKQDGETAEDGTVDNGDVNFSWLRSSDAFTKFLAVARGF